MTIALNIYRARIGLHHYQHSKVKGLGTLNDFELVTFLAMLLYQSGDIEKILDLIQLVALNLMIHFSFPLFKVVFPWFTITFKVLLAKLISSNLNLLILILFSDRNLVE